MLQRIAELSGNVILRQDLADLGNPRQVSRALKTLLQEKKIIRFGYGIYVKAKYSRLIGESIMSVSFPEACIETLNRLGIKWELGTAIKDYNEGRTQQVPVQYILKIYKRFRRRLGDENRELIIEGVVNAR